MVWVVIWLGLEQIVMAAAIIKSLERIARALESRVKDESTQAD